MEWRRQKRANGFGTRAGRYGDCAEVGLAADVLGCYLPLRMNFAAVFQNVESLIPVATQRNENEFMRGVSGAQRCRLNQRSVIRVFRALERWC
jgi:hypothetical protein